MEMKAAGESDMTEEIAMAIFESLGQPDSTVSQRMAMAEKLISDQRVDLEKLKNRFSTLCTTHEGKEETLKQLKEKTREVQMFLQQLSDWGAALDEEEASLTKEIARLEESPCQDMNEDPPKQEM